MSKRSIKGKIIFDDRILYGYLITKNERITEITPKRSHGEITYTGNAFIISGFVDLLIHDLYLRLVDNGAEELKEICKIPLQYGIIGFLPTLAPRPKEEDTKFISELSRTETAGTEICIDQ